MFPVEQFYMQQALRLAKRGKLTVSPNPMVGCIIVNQGIIVGEGWHHFAGSDHAEIHALKQAKEKAKGATVYVTLEPCCYQGRTRACTTALIKAKVKKLIIATKDPNPKVSGKGIKLLKQHGIEVIVGIEQDNARQLNKIFFHFHQKKRPFVIAKWGMSLDGQTTVEMNDAKQITNQESQQRVHDLRNQLDAIIVGAKTIIDDNPLLTVRYSTASRISQPLRIVISASAHLPLDANVFDTKMAKTLLFHGDSADIHLINALQKKGVECIALPIDQNNKMQMKSVLTILAQKGITSVLIEGGQALHQSFFSEGLVDEVQSFISPVLINGFDQKHYLSQSSSHHLEDDIYIYAQLKEEKYV